jgi:ribonucleoside-diphosphate reductase alpha chain
MQQAWQENVDNGVSKTVNLPNEATINEVGAVYTQAWKLGLKAVAIYRDGSKTTQVLNVGEPEMAAEVQDAVIGPHRHKEPRPVVLTGHTERVETGIGALYVTVNEQNGNPFELFAQVGRAGSEVAAFTEGLARLTSLALRHGVSPDEVSAQLTGIGGAHINGFGQGKVLSVPDALGQILEHVAKHEPTGEGSLRVGITVDSDICPECHQGTLIPQEGCTHCSACGYSDC